MAESKIPLRTNSAQGIPPAHPTEADLQRQIRALQQQLGIPTDSEYDPLAPGGNDQELWPAQPAEAWWDFRLA